MEERGTGPTGSLGLHGIDPLLPRPRTEHLAENTVVKSISWEEDTALAPKLGSITHTCGMPYWSMTCQMYQSSFRDVFRNRKVVTKAYSSGRPWGKTSLRTERQTDGSRISEKNGKLAKEASMSVQLLSPDSVTPKDAHSTLSVVLMPLTKTGILVKLSIEKHCGPFTAFAPTLSGHLLDHHSPDD